MNPGGKPPIAGPPVEEAAPGVMDPDPLRFGCGAGAPCRETEKAFIFAMISGFICGGAPLAPAKEPAAGGGFPRAALSCPRGVLETVMFETVEAGDISDVVRSDAS